MLFSGFVIALPLQSRGVASETWLYKINLAVFQYRLTTSIGHRANTAVGMLLDPSLSTIRPVNLFCKLTKGHF